MSIENHEYINNKNDGISILAKEFGLGNDPKFGDFLNKKFDEFLGKESHNERHQTCRDNRDSSDFYKYLILCKNGLIDDELVRGDLGYIVENGYKSNQFYERDFYKIENLFRHYSIFKNRINVDSITYNVDKQDFNNFLRSSIINIFFTFGECPNLYETLNNFLHNKIYELSDLYKKINKNKNKSQNWDVFFNNNGQVVISQIKGLYDKYTKSPEYKIGLEGYKRGKIESLLSRVLLKTVDKETIQFFSDVFYELHDDRLLNDIFLQRLFFGMNDNSKLFLNSREIQDSFTKAKGYLNKITDKKLIKNEKGRFNSYRENIRSKLINFIPDFYSSYTNSYTPLPVFYPPVFFGDENQFEVSKLKSSEELTENSYGEEFRESYAKLKTYNVQDKFNKMSEVGARLASIASSYGNNSILLSPMPVMVPAAFLNTYQSRTNSGNKPSLNVSNGDTLPSRTSSGNEPSLNVSNGDTLPSRTSSGNEPSLNIEGEYGEEINIKNTIERIKNNDDVFKNIRETTENLGIYISDEDIIYSLLYFCSIKNDDRINDKQKQYISKLLEVNPANFIIGKEIFEKIIKRYIDIDSELTVLNSNGEDELLEQNENSMKELNQFFVKTQKKMITLANTDDIKEYCKSIASKIKNFETINKCENLVSEKISNLIPLLLNLNKIKGHDYYNTRGLFMLYLMLTDYKNIGKINDNNIDRVIDMAFGEGNDTSGEFADLKSHRKNKMESYQEYIIQRITKYDHDVLEYNNGIIARYEKAKAEAENRKFYGAAYINFSNASNNPQDQTGMQLASRIDNLDKKLHNYKLKKTKNEMSEHEKSALMYTAFETTFNNTFNLNDVIVQKLVDLKIDLRSELTNYGIYDKEKNSFDKNARNKFVKDRLLNTGFSIEEIETLGKTMEELPNEVEKNYEILCGNFDADQDGFEKISKIYALGEIIDNIRTLFSDLSSKKLGNFMNLQLDEESPADIIGDCLFIKGKVNGTETNIKYDLRTGKVYMNSFTEQILNPPKIIIGNTTPNKEIGDFGSFDDAISNMNSAFMIQNNENNDSGNFNNLGDTPNDDNDSSENKQDPEDLIKNKLNRDLKSIGKIVNDEVGKQTLENDIINGFLKTFGISSNTGGSKEFVGSSKLYTILNNFINIDNEFELTEISNYMKKILKLLSFSRGEDNQTLSENKLKQNDRSNSYDIESFTIFDIDEKHATEEIKSLQIQTRKFFPNGNGNGGEKNKIGELAHFDEDVNISIINVIVDKCCIDGKLSKKSLENYFEHIHKEIIKNLSESDKATADSGLKDQLEFV